MSLFRHPLFGARFFKRRADHAPTPPEHKKLLADWAATIRDGSIFRQRESELRAPFVQRFFVELLGYRPFGHGPTWTINDEKRTGAGAADTALGLFSAAEKKVIAPVELKGADTRDLDAIMPGRHKSPVQQAWEYAMDTPGCQFLLVSNMVEIRLYAVGHTRQVYERFDILELADSDAAYRRFRLLLAAENLLSGQTARFLAESAQADQDPALIEGGPALAADAGSCDDGGHEPEPHSADRQEAPAMARPASGRCQPARRVSGESDRDDAQLDGAGKRAGGSPAPHGAPDSTRPLDATRELATAAGLKPYSDVAEALAENLARCLDRLLDQDPDAIAISPDWLREIHRQIAGDLFPDWAGRWRTVEVQVGSHFPPPPHDVAVQVRNFCLDLEERLRHAGDARSLAELLAWADWRFQWIHPFKDFNGRVGRVLLAALAYTLGLPPIEVVASEAGRNRYFEALRVADKGDLRPLAEIWLSRLDEDQMDAVGAVRA